VTGQTTTQALPLERAITAPGGFETFELGLGRRVRAHDHVYGLEKVRNRAAMESESSTQQAGVSFERDVRPLFRERDRGAMLGVAKFDLWEREDVAQHSQDILERLEDGSMPCDQPWPESQVSVFRRWVDAGMPA
jgi:hypothetical protein